MASAADTNQVDKPAETLVKSPSVECSPKKGKWLRYDYPTNPVDKALLIITVLL